MTEDIISMAFAGATDINKIKCVYCEKLKNEEDFEHSNGYHGTCSQCYFVLETTRDWDYACSLLQKKRDLE
jgi:hypothetical protein